MNPPRVGACECIPARAPAGASCASLVSARAALPVAPVCLPCWSSSRCWRSWALASCSWALGSGPGDCCSSSCSLAATGDSDFVLRLAATGASFGDGVLTTGGAVRRLRHGRHRRDLRLLILRARCGHQPRRNPGRRERLVLHRVAHPVALDVLLEAPLDGVVESGVATGLLEVGVELD